jgi:hypothetical protein
MSQLTTITNFRDLTPMQTVLTDSEIQAKTDFIPPTSLLKLGSDHADTLKYIIQLGEEREFTHSTTAPSKSWHFTQSPRVHLTVTKSLNLVRLEKQFIRLHNSQSFDVVVYVLHVGTNGTKNQFSTSTPIRLAAHESKTI